MRVLQKALLASVAGGEADEVVWAYGGGDTGTWDGNWGGESDYSWDGGGGDYGGADFSSADSGAGDSGGGGSAIAPPSFDGNGVGMTSCVPMPPPPPPLSTGLFGYSMTETMTLATSLGSGVVGSMAAESLGGWSAIGSLGAAGLAMGGAGIAGIAASGIIGRDIGSALYHNSDTVQEWSQKAWGGVFQIIEDITQGGAELLDIDRKPHPVYHP